jgi:hypothetical protein
MSVKDVVKEYQPDAYRYGYLDALAKVEKMAEEFADDAAGGGNTPACQAFMTILSLIRAMKEGGK